MNSTSFCYSCANCVPIGRFTKRAMGLITGLGIAFGGGSAFAAAVTGGKPVRASGAIQTLYLNLSDVWAGGIVFFSARSFAAHGNDSPMPAGRPGGIHSSPSLISI